MILKEGRYYRSREGRTYGPLARYEKKCSYQFFCGGESWAEDGRASIDHTHSPHDLIVEITELEANPPALTPNATPKVDRVVLASKILPRLAPDLTPPMAARQALQYADAFLKEIEND